VLELLLLFALLLALVRALRARHRWAVTCGAVALYLLVADTLGVVAASGGPRSMYSLFNDLFLGPGSSLERAAALLPLPVWLVRYPLLLRALRVALCSAASWRCLSEASQLNPLLPRAYQLDGVALPFAGAAVLDCVETIVLVFALLLAARD
jgi:hypothetical protein